MSLFFTARFRGAAIAAATYCCLIGCCLAQGRGGVDSRAAMPLIQEVLSKAQFSGSLEYRGACTPHKPSPDFPQLRWPTGRDSSPLEFLRAMFDVDPYMRVTKDTDGKIRMVETDVPNDVLDVKIHHLSFYRSDASESEPVHGAQMALLAVLKTPEVMAFGQEHKIGGLPRPNWAYVLPGNCCGGGRIAQGDLDDVTVSQALDYVLQTFPGFWLYENCQDSAGGRTVSFNFYPILPASVYARKTVPSLENN